MGISGEVVCLQSARFEAQQLECPLLERCWLGEQVEGRPLVATVGDHPVLDQGRQGGEERPEAVYGEPFDGASAPVLGQGFL